MELKIKDLTKSFGNTEAVSHISYTLTNGVYGLLGVNGAGKTTLMRMLCTLIEPSSGSITWNGRDIFQMGGAYRDILGYLPQEFGYYPDFNLEDYLMYIASIKGLKPSVTRHRAGELLQQVGLAQVRKKKIKKLSGGMKRRLGIAQAMLNHPELLILDEPTAGLDPNERIRFRNLISELAADRIVLLSTHIVSDVEYIARDIILMKGGRIECSGSAKDLVNHMPWNVWELNVPQSDIHRFMKAYKVANVKMHGNLAGLRILSEEKPGENAVFTDASLEDVFLYYFGTKGDEGDGLL